MADLLEPRVKVTRILKALELLSLLPAALRELKGGQRDKLRKGETLTPPPVFSWAPSGIKYQRLGERKNRTCKRRYIRGG